MPAVRFSKRTRPILVALSGAAKQPCRRPGARPIDVGRRQWVCRYENQRGGRVSLSLIGIPLLTAQLDGTTPVAVVVPRYRRLVVVRQPGSRGRTVSTAFDHVNVF